MDAQVARRLPGVRPRGERRALRGRGRDRVRRLLPRRHGRDDRPCSRAHGAGDRRAGGPWDHVDASERGRPLGVRGARAPVRPSVVAVRAERHRREPFSIRLARHVTGRPKVLVFNWCYHGTVDESFATLADGEVVARSGNLGRRSPRRDDARRRVQRRRRARARARARRRGPRPHRARVDERRDRHAEAGFHEALRGLPVRTARCSRSTRRTPSAAARVGSPRSTGSSRTS